ncbi:S8 family serine peptidase [Tropicibacter sp. R16_0]|uniref:S8 family serine peptidase n=1 Tax=Tropicibacter sp. R16_0 TaxID=2821102 RepID=UPI001ADA8E2E|nr:S8 family serine peptidase [Tropicibacter sp. R16_0]MBO9449907.1 S8 family serine peptidase [Tropicibacter sp. R16_0]
MTLKWRELLGSQKPRNPEAFFALNAMQRFFEADLGLDGTGPSSETRTFDDQWWLALVSVARRGDGDDQRVSIAELVAMAKDYRLGPLDDALVIPGEYTSAYRDRRDLDVITIYARKAYLEAANRPDGQEALGIATINISAPLDFRTLNSASGIFEPPTATVTVSDDTVVTAVIDHGIAIAHDLFRRNNAGGMPIESRVDFFLDMDGEPDANAPLQSTVGRAWTRQEIEGVLSTNFKNGLLDEAAVYRDLGLINWQDRAFNACTQRVSHGTHVMGLASGYDPSDAQGSKHRIIAVQLPTSLVANTIGFGLDNSLERALDFIGQQLAHYEIDSETADLPVAINFSFGNFMGPHDGTGDVDRAIDAALTAMAADSDTPKMMFLPSGNGHLSRCHAVLNLTEADPDEALDWMLPPGDRSASVLSAWLPRQVSVEDDTVDLEISVPGMATPQTLSAGNMARILLLEGADPSGNAKIVAVAAYQPPRSPTFRGRFLVLVAPTDNPKDARPLAPSGIWNLRFVKGSAVETLALNVWVQRDETLPNFPVYGRQSYLSDRHYDRFTEPGGSLQDIDLSAQATPVRRAGMINGIACGNLPSVIAGYVRSDRNMAKYSAGGPTLNSLRLNGPDASAVSDDSVVLSGVLSAGSSSGSRVAMNGTSVATPRVTRWAASEMSANPTTPFTRSNVINRALNDDPNLPSKPSLNRTGGGRIRFESVFGGLRWPGQ